MVLEKMLKIKSLRPLYSSALILEKFLARIQLLVVVYTMVLSGCVIHNPDYPAQWAALDTFDKDNCFALAGVYSERGESSEPGFFYEDGKPVPIVPQLSGIVLGYSSKADPATRVKLSNPEPGTLEVAAYDNQKLLAKARFSEKVDTYVCNQNNVKIFRYSGSPSGKGAPVVGYENEAIFLYKAVDGSLVLKVRGSFFGMVFLLIPAGGTDVHWDRFKPISTAGQ